MKKPKRLRQAIGTDPNNFNKSQIKIYAYVIPIALFTALPIIMIILNAFKPLSELNAYPPRFYVVNPTLEHFRRLFHIASNTSFPAMRYLFNSFIYTLPSVALSILFSLTAAYCLSKKQFKMKKVIMTVNMLALMFVPVAVSIPRYFVVVYSGIHNTYLAGILPGLAMPVGLFLVKQFMDQIPDALIEAAQIDGASDYFIIRGVIAPMVMPALATVGILAFQGSWNNLEASQLYIDNESIKNFAFYMSTLAVGTGNTLAGQGVSAVATLIMFIPNMLLFIVLQSRVMNTMAHSGIK